MQILKGFIKNSSTISDVVRFCGKPFNILFCLFNFFTKAFTPGKNESTESSSGGEISRYDASSNGRYLLITGLQGVGKSSFLANLVYILKDVKE